MVVSVFDRAWRSASKAIDKCYGEAFQYQPMRHSSEGGRLLQDNTRAAVTITGALAETAAIIEPMGKRVAANTFSQNSGSFSTIDIARDALGYLPRINDRLLCIRTGGVFEVNAIEDDRIARIVLRVWRLNQVNGQ